MLQIIGFIGCFYLILKCIEFFGSNAFRDGEGQLVGAGMAGGILAIVGALLFMLMLTAQGSSLPSASSTTSFSSAPAEQATAPAADDPATEKSDDALNAAANDVAAAANQQ